MRALLALAAALLVPFATAGAQPQGEERYLPTGIWRYGTDDFFERWYGSHLRAMGEPILSRPGDRMEFRRRFRMLVLPHYSRPWALRIDERRGGDAWVRTVELGGPGAGPPREISRQDRFRIGRAALGSIERSFRLSELRRLAPQEPPDPEPEPVAGQDGDSRTIVICLHATQYVFELVDAAGYHIVTRSACDLTPELGTLIRSLQPLRRGVGLPEVRPRTISAGRARNGHCEPQTMPSLDALPVAGD